MSVTKQHGCFVIRPSAGLTTNDSSLLGAFDRQLTIHGSRTIIAIVDIDECHNVTAGGADMLRIIHAMVAHVGGHAAMTGARREVLEFLDNHGIAPLFHQFRTLDHALASFTSP